MIFKVKQPKKRKDVFGTYRMIGQDNKKILAYRRKQFNKRKGIRVGDYIKEKNGNLTRVTYIWKFIDTPKGEYQVQTGGNGGSYYLGENYTSYSGGLDEGYKYKQLKKTNKTKEGSVWFFNKDIAGAGRGKNYNMKFRIWEVK